MENLDTYLSIAEHLFTIIVAVTAIYKSVKLHFTMKNNTNLKLQLERHQDEIQVLKMALRKPHT